MVRTALAHAPELQIVIASRHLTGLPGEMAYPVARLEIPPRKAAKDRLGDYPASRALPDPRLPAHHPTRPDLRGRGGADLPSPRRAAAGPGTGRGSDRRADGRRTRRHAADRTELPAGARTGPADRPWSMRWSAGATGCSPRPSRRSSPGSPSSQPASPATRWQRSAAKDSPRSNWSTCLSSLVSKSLVERRDEVGATHARFRLLQLIGEYARTRFDELADREVTRRRHAEYFCNLVGQAAGRLTGHDQGLWLDLLDVEMGNIRRAIQWAAAHEPDLALRMVAGLGRWIYLRGHYTEGRRLAGGALDAAAESAATLRAPVLALAGSLAFLQCEYADATAFTEQARQLFSEAQDASGIGWATGRLAGIARERGAYDRAEALHREAMELARARGDAYEEANQLNYLSFVAWLRGDWAAAEPLGRESLARMRKLNNREGVIWALINLGASARYRGDLAGARTAAEPVPHARRGDGVPRGPGVGAEPAWGGGEAERRRRTRARAAAGQPRRASGPRRPLATGQRVRRTGGAGDRSRRLRRGRRSPGRRRATAYRDRRAGSGCGASRTRLRPCRRSGMHSARASTPRPWRPACNWTRLQP